MGMVVRSIVDMDTYGCLRKLLCLIRGRREDDLTVNEKVFLEVFSLPDSSQPLPPSSLNKLVQQEADGGGAEATCDTKFPKCQLEEDLLRLMLRSSSA